MLTLADIAFDEIAVLLCRFELKLEQVADCAAIPGSYWGGREAGIIGSTVHARADTPVHSLLHEAAHLVVLPRDRREAVHTNATASVDEENAVLVLQALLADQISGVGRTRILADMDSWGYTFRLGSARAYIERDADEAWAWLAARGLVDGAHELVFPPSTRTPHIPAATTRLAPPATSH
jgi:hypothetical protein